MIINTGARTDTVHYYTPWLMKRFHEGFVLVRNPFFPKKVIRYSLSPDTVDCVVFCSKNYRPILDHIEWFMSRFSTYFFYTITAYGKDIEPGVPSIDESIETLMQLSAIAGRERVVWRYDPVFLTEKYTFEVHRDTFTYLSSRLTPYVDRCVFSFVEMYRKLERNFPSLRPLSQEEKDALACMLGEVASSFGLKIQTCATEEDWSGYGIRKSGCITLEALGKANGISFDKVRHSGMRKNCHCVPSHDIGSYNSCPNGCLYCYANSDHRKAGENFLNHDPASPLLVGTLEDDDIVVDALQKSFVSTQLELF